MEYKWKLPEVYILWNSTEYREIFSVNELVKLTVKWLIIGDITSIISWAHTLFDYSKSIDDKIIICKKVIELITAFMKNKDEKHCTALKNIKESWQDKLKWLSEK